jgi:hypothetical protein
MKRLLLLAACLPFDAGAALLAWCPTSTGRIEFHDEAGAICKAPARRLVFIGNDGAMVDGCWTVRQEGVLTVFVDGDAYLIPAAALRKPVAL